MSDAPDLLPCPFCGSTRAWPIPANRKSEDRLYPIVRCGGCFLDLPGKNDDYSLNAKSAVAMWNTRSDTIPGVLAQARAEGREQGWREAQDAAWNDAIHAAIHAVRGLDFEYTEPALLALRDLLRKENDR